MRLATWNLEHFWQVPNEPLLIRKNGDATRLRDVRLLERTKAAVQSLGADILCLQEIGGFPTLQFLAPNARHFVEARLNPDASPKDRRHGLGFAIAQHLKVEALPEIDLRQAEGGDDYARNALPLLIDERYIVVGVHLKSGCRDKLRLDKRAPCKILSAQVDLLCDWAAKQTLPLVMMGDFNRVLGQPRDTVWAKLRAAADLQLSPLRFRQIDHILTPSVWKVEDKSQSRLRGFSDHIPILITAKT